MNLYHIDKSELIRGGRIFLSLFMIVSLIVLSPSASAGDDYEAYQQSATAVENLAAEIRMSEGAVGQTLMEAMNGKFGEMNKWAALDEKMNALGQTIDRNLPEIGKNAEIMLSQDPNVNLPSVALGQTFDGNLKMVRDQKKALSDMANAERGKLQKINAMIARTDKNILNAAKGLMGDTIEGLLPNEVELAGEGTVLILSLYFGPPGWVVGTIMAGTLVFNDMVDLYYNSKAAADQARVLSQMKQSLEANRKRLEQNLQTLMDGLKEITQIEQILDKHKKKMDEYKAKVNTAVEGWNGQSQSAFEKRKQKLSEETKKKAAEPKPTINLSSYAYGMEPIPPIEPGEYAGEVDSMIAQMESYTRAVEDGGDPDNFQSMVIDWSNRKNEQYTKAKEDYDKKYAAYSKASEICYNQINQAAKESNGAYRALWAAYSGRYWDDAAYAAAGAISNRYDSAVKTAYAGLKPYGQALIAPYREMSRLGNIYYRVGDAYYPFGYRIYNATQARTKEFWKERELWQTVYNDVNIKVYQTVADIPYWLPEWKNRAGRIDADVESALYWGQDIVSVRSGLLATANQLKELDKTVRDANKAYQEANPERISISNQAQSELGSLITKYGRLINYYWASNFYMPSLGGKAEFTPHAPEQELNIKYLTEEVKKSFMVNEAGNLEEAKKVDLLAIAQIYENKAQELIFYTDWIEQYRFRLSAAVSHLDIISRKQTGTGFYADRENIKDALDKEFSEAPFGNIMKDVEGLVTAEELGKLPWIKVQPWAGMNLWQKLYAAQTVLLNKMNDEIKYYVQARSQGWFQPVNENIIKPLEERWKKLRALCEKYDAAAKPLRENIGNAQEEISKESAPVWETYNKMPQLSRNAVSAQHPGFQSAFNWLSNYVNQKTEALKFTLEPPTNSVAVQLDNLITGYRPALEKYMRQQEEQQRLFEEQNKRFEEEKRKREEEENKRAEEERRRQEELQKQASAELNAVKDLYAKFKEAYESKNDSQVISFISDEWETGDGVTLSDLQENLHNSFSVFNEMRYNISNLNITKSSGDKYIASYDVIITGRIYENDIKHEEKSTVNEMLIIDKSGKVKIFKTLSGRFWYVE